MAANARGVVGELRNTLDNAGKKFALAVDFSGANAKSIEETRRLGSSSILATLGALPKNVNQPKPAPPVVLGKSAENNGKTILDYLSSGLDRFLLSINICIVLLRAADFDKTTVDSALAFVRELKVLYDDLCASVTPAGNMNAKVNSVKGALNALLSQKIPDAVMAALQRVKAPKNANDRGFNGYSRQVQLDAVSTVPLPNNGPHVPVPNNVPAAARAEAARKAPAWSRSSYDIAMRALREQNAARAATGQVPAGTQPPALAPGAPPVAPQLPVPPQLPVAPSLPRPPAGLLHVLNKVGTNAAEIKRLRNVYNSAVRELMANPTQEEQNKADQAYRNWAVATGRTDVPPPPPISGLAPRAPASAAPVATINSKHENIEFKRSTAPMRGIDYIAEKVILNPDKTVFSIEGKESDPNTTVISIGFLHPKTKNLIQILDQDKMGRTQDGFLFFSNTFIDLNEPFIASIKTTSRKIPAGGRRRTKAKTKAKSKAKASRNTKRRSTRRNRRS